MKNHPIFWLIALLMLLGMAGCTTKSVDINFDKDPQIFTGSWKGTAAAATHNAVVVSPDKSLIAMSTGNQDLLILDSSNGKVLKTLSGVTTGPRGFSSDNKFLLEVGGLEKENGVYGLQTRDTTTWQIMQSIPLNNIYTSSVSDDNKWAMDVDKSSSSVVRVLNLETGQVVKTINIGASGSRYLSPHGKYIVVNHFLDYGHFVPFTIDIWSVERGDRITLNISSASDCEYTHHIDQLFSSDDETKMGIVLDGKQIQIWDFEQAKLIKVISSGTCSSIEFPTLSANGNAGSSVVWDGRKTYQMDWDSTGNVQFKDISSLLPSIPLPLAVLVPNQAYLMLSGPHVKLLRVGTLPWEWAQNNKVFDLSFDVSAKKIGSSKYAVSGTALVDGQQFAATGLCTTTLVNFTSVSSSYLPAFPTLHLNLTLTDKTGIRFTLDVQRTALDKLNSGDKIGYYSDFSSYSNQSPDTRDSVYPVTLERP